MKLIPNLSEIDRQTTLQTGISAEALMENAGAQVALTIQNVTRHTQTGVIVCGPGNNGGDGFVCARKLYEAGYQSLIVVYTGTNYRNESLANLEKILTGLPIEAIPGPKTGQAIARIQKADFIVDALFGSGLSRAISGIEAQLVEAMNQRSHEIGCPVIAVDMPSGVNGENGQTSGVTVHASQTVTFATGKPGLYLYPGKGHAGEVSVADIGIPASLIDEDESPFRLMSGRQARQWLPERKADSHKYSYGHLLVIAGSEAMPGAAVLSAEAAMRCGAGLVTLAAVTSVFEQLPLMPEIIRLRLPDTTHLTEASVITLRGAFDPKKYNAVVVGPGLGRDPETLQAMRSLFEWLKNLSIPVIVDADGLYALAQAPMNLSENFILTPHVGECARLLGLENTVISADLPNSAQAARKRYGANLVLKSASTVIATLESGTSDQTCWISPTGNAGMATAGSGDVLTGVIAALAAQKKAQGKAFWHAATLGVFLHGLAGEAAAQKLTPYAMRASSISDHLPDAFRQLLNQPEQNP